MTELYTAVGKVEYRGDGGYRYPVVIIDGQESALDMKEMIVWCCLNWRVLNLEQLKTHTREMGEGDNYHIAVDCFQCVSRLIQRRLVAVGRGDTERDALCALILDRCILPLKATRGSKLVAFFKASFINGYPLSVALQIFNKPQLTAEERQILDICRRSELCTAADIIRSGFVVEGKEKANTNELGPSVDPCARVVAAVANLLLHKQIILAK